VPIEKEENAQQPASQSQATNQNNTPSESEQESMSSVSFLRQPLTWLAQDWKGNSRGRSKEEIRRLKITGLISALALGLHNFPEGLATFVGALADSRVGIALAVAIAIHNVPEGICVAMPIYYATGSRLKGFLWAFLSGISEPIGAAIGWAIISMYISFPPSLYPSFPPSRS